MVSSSASDEHELTPLVTPLPSTMVTPAADSGSQALLLTRDGKWLAGAGIAYALLVVLGVLTLNAYFSQTWDAVTFVKAGKSVLSPDWMMLYAQSRADQYWPYAYPPLHAFLVAPFVALAGAAPDWLMVRVPPMLFDIALGFLLYAVVARKTENKNWARLAMAVWLLNPVTFYDTAVQGHFEAEWLFFIVLAYFLYETKRGWLLPTLALSVAFLFKQNSILFAMPLWADMFFGGDEPSWARRAVAVVRSMVAYAIPILVISLPFLLASNDYWYMNVQYVADVPLQTQSWLVALANLLGPDNVILRLSSILTLVAAFVISILAARRKMGIWLAAFLIVLAFFLLSKKVVGYYYVMILPFALVTLVPAKRFRLLSLILAAISFISLAPYFASWANQDHGWIYGLLGIVNSLVWLGIFVWLWHKHPISQSEQNARTPVFISIALFLSAVSATLLQPLVASASSPIRAPLIAPGFESQALLIFVGFAVLVAIGLVVANLFTRTIARAPRIQWGAYALVVLLTPLFFLTFTLTKESTAALESFLALVGL